MRSPLEPAAATSPYVSSFPEGARSAPGRPLDAFAIGRREALQRRAGVAARGVQPQGTALGAHGSHGRCYCDPLRCLLLSLRADAMKRRSRAGGKPAKARPRKALKLKGRSAPKALSLGRSSLGQTEVARLTRERDEALAQQAATADVLQTISSSPGNLDSVLETILANATRLCEANFGVLLLYESAQFCCNGKPLKSWVIF